MPLPKSGKKLPRLTGPRSISHHQPKFFLNAIADDPTEVAELGSKDGLNILLVGREYICTSQNGVSKRNSTSVDSALDCVHGKELGFVCSEGTQQVVNSQRIPILLKWWLLTLERARLGCILIGFYQGRADRVKSIGRRGRYSNRQELHDRLLQSVEGSSGSFV